MSQPFDNQGQHYKPVNVHVEARGARLIFMLLCVRYGCEIRLCLLQFGLKEVALLRPLYAGSAT